ncbi:MULTISPECIES: hypothetical protein [Mesoflavibacter]|uniref:KAP NTPase domain-containing protein n=1 Tax=Mesoflavibacter profundi TaxID=2708110 RepID=A0ABT4RYK8_9FLAO|nr:MULTISPECIES: hypothetical protein [Mesoflavibacter]MDA0176605.1 hypothetical protein [Mesoflavibacter profundi]QIJ90261.1 hypothetical protein C7H62_2453 [Mesoflavibacter sp. HG96]QIJ92989.1 hypothetical protein C7H56_2453 [Mesoflavibacter sp. HG37]
MAIEINEERKREILNSFIDNKDFYKTSELREVRRVIVDSYYNDYDIFQKISNSSKTRNLLCSTSLLNKIITEISGGRYNFREEDHFVDILLIVKNMNKYEDTFFNKSLLITSLEFVAFLVGIIDAHIIKNNKAEDFEKELNEFYIFFKRIIGKIDIEQKDENKYQSIYTTIKTYFKYNNYQYSNYWFKFYFLFYFNHKGNNARKTDAINTISSSYIRLANDPKELKEIISETIDFECFMKLESNFQTEIFNLCKTKPPFAKEFFSEFSVEKKQQILEFYIPVNRNKAIPSLKQLLEAIDYNIPNELEFVNKVLNSTKTLTIHTERKELYDILFNSKIDSETIKTSDYSNQIIGLICNTNANLHELGISEFNEHSVYVDKQKLKDKAIPFLLKLITNLAAYGQFYVNILNLKIGIDKTYFDSELKKSTSYLAHINNYIVSSGNLRFYNSIVSKVKEETVLNINDHFIRSINYHNKYDGILKIIFENKNLLSDDLHDKLSKLISNIK